MIVESEFCFPFGLYFGVEVTLLLLGRAETGVLLWSPGWPGTLLGLVACLCLELEVKAQAT